MPETLSLLKSNISFAKLTSTPTEKAWSQAYNAGSLFACLSLNSENSGESLHSLQELGKNLFSNLEAEFFTLEEKNLTTIKEAVQKSITHIPDGIVVDFCLGYFKEDILYLFILGEGRAIMKRGDNFGTLLAGKRDSEEKIQTASGHLENDDILILETSKFAGNISEKNLSEGMELSLPNDIAEALSVHMHEKPDGDQAAIIITYHGFAKPVPEKSESDDDITLADIQNEETDIVTPQKIRLPQLTSLFKLPKLSKLTLPHLPNMPYLNHRKKFFLSISVIILILLVVSIVLTKQKQVNSKNLELFNSIYVPALKSYDEGTSLKTLNAALSKEDFGKAKQLLSDGINKFPQGSKEDRQIEELLTKVQSELGLGDQASLTEVSADSNNILALEKANSNANGFSQNNDNVYFVTNEAIFSVNKKSGKKTELIKNDNYWKSAVAVAPFQANFYVLDIKNGILKFVPSGNDFSKSDYLKDSANLTSAKSMTIDSAIFVLFSDGNIKKYLRGSEEKFTISSLDKPLTNPTKVFTDTDTDNLYILDNGNSRVVVLGKDGAFKNQYSAGIIADAKDFEVLEKDKKINILSNDKIYQLDL